MSGTAKHVFILGKNRSLSLAELLSFTKTRGRNLRIVDLSDSFVATDAEGLLDSETIRELGGTLKIGRVTAVLPVKSLRDAFTRRRKDAEAEIKSLLSSSNVTDAIFTKPSDKYLFGVSIYTDNLHFLRSAKALQRLIGSYFKRELVLRGAKAKFMGTPKERQLPQLTNVEVLKKNLIEKSAEVLFCIGKDDAFLSRTMAIHNPFDFQKRDVERPVQRKIFSIPPRIARIMVNFSSCLPGKVFLDPFCGVGTILQEAMHAGAQVVGIDNDPWCVSASAKNLDWLRKEYDLEKAKSRVMLGDARRLAKEVGEGSIDCVATEPTLGPALRDVPTESYAKRIINGLEPLYYDFLGEAYKALKTKGKAVFVTPYIRTRRGTFQSMSIKQTAANIGFRIVPPFVEIRADDSYTRNLTDMSSLIDIDERHKIGREIHILQK